MVMDVVYTSLLLGVVLSLSWLMADSALRGKMHAFYVVSGVIGLGLLVYLFVAVFRPTVFG